MQVNEIKKKINKLLTTPTVVEINALAENVSCMNDKEFKLFLDANGPYKIIKLLEKKEAETRTHKNYRMQLSFLKYFPSFNP